MINVIGGGLAGCEAAWQIAEAGCEVTLREMRPTATTAAHRTDKLSELVCSTSLKSDDIGTAHGILKREMRALGSLMAKLISPVALYLRKGATSSDSFFFSREMTPNIASIAISALSV